MFIDFVFLMGPSLIKNKHCLKASKQTEYSVKMFVTWQICYKKSLRKML